MRCQGCKKDIPDGNRTKRCDGCLETLRKHNAKRRREARESGICTVCQKWPAVGDLTRCQGCYDRETSIHKDRQEACRSAGMCWRCYTRKAAPGRASCLSCLKRKRSLSARRRRVDRVPAKAREKLIDIMSLDGGWLSLRALAEYVGGSTRNTLKVLQELEVDGVVSSRTVETDDSFEKVYLLKNYGVVYG